MFMVPCCSLAVADNQGGYLTGGKIGQVPVSVKYLFGTSTCCKAACTVSFMADEASGGSFRESYIAQRESDGCPGYGYWKNVAVRILLSKG